MPFCQRIVGNAAWSGSAARSDVNKENAMIAGGKRSNTRASGRKIHQPHKEKQEPVHGPACCVRPETQPHLEGSRLAGGGSNARTSQAHVKHGNPLRSLADPNHSKRSSLPFPFQPGEKDPSRTFIRYTAASRGERDVVRSIIIPRGGQPPRGRLQR